MLFFSLSFRSRPELSRPSLFILALFITFITLLPFTPSVVAQPESATTERNTPPIAIDNANWSATDALGRKLPGYQEVGDPKPNRWVGLFYWQWHGTLRAGPDYDMTKFLKSHPGFKDFNAFPPGGPAHPTWYWAQPLFGYYRSTDPWVIRKHLALFADAGVDFLFMDYTNSSVYDAELTTFLAVAEEMKAQGVPVPRICFFLNSQPEWKAEHLYRLWYKPGKHDAMWFRWQGKPLILSPKPADASKFKGKTPLAEVQNYFTWRPTWALFDAKRDPTQWRFMATHPQPPALGPDGGYAGKIEQMVVSKSMGGPIWDNMKKGGVSCVPGHEPTYNDQWVSPDQAKGLFFDAQWRVAKQVGAPILLVTGWNEWTASVWEQPGVPMLGRRTAKGQGHIVDEFNTDFNRDLEPMKDMAGQNGAKIGYGDDYYWQFVSHLRQYKGMNPPQKPTGPRTLSVDKTIAAWDAVRPLYHDWPADIANRDFDGSVKGTHYTDHSARNDIILAQTARDNATIYFHVRAANPLTPPGSAGNWMTLFIDADANASTGWHGYDLLINRARSESGRDGMKCSVERNVGDGWKWQKIADAPIRWSGADLVLAVPRQALDLPPATVAAGKKGKLQFDFKWADNLPAEPKWMDFYTAGDAAPDARFNYRFEE